MGTTVGIGNRVGGGNNFSWSSYWAQSNKVLFFGLYSEISGGQMPNKVAGSTDYLTVSGSTGSETFQAPDTAPYKAADTDYIWFTTLAVQRTTTTAELIAYDLQRTPVKYGNVTPNALNAIIILKAGETLTSDEIDRLHTDMSLSVYWSGVWNDNGSIKDNRTVNQSVYYVPESAALFARMVTASETPNYARKKIINDTVIGLQVNGLWSKMDACWLMASHGTLSARMNWIADAYNLTQGTGLPEFEVDRGFLGVPTTKFLKTGFVPSTASGKYAANDAAFGVYCRLNKNESTTIMGMRDAISSYSTYIFPRDSNKAYGVSQAKTPQVTPDNLDSSGLIVFSRNAANAQNLYVRGTKTSNATAAIKLETEEFYILGYNAGGTVNYVSTNQIAFAFLSSKLVDADVALLNTIIVDGYLNSVGAKI